MNETFQITIWDEILHRLLIWIYIAIVLLSGVMLLILRVQFWLRREPDSHWTINDLKGFIVWLVLMSIGSLSIGNVGLRLFQPPKQIIQRIIDNQVNESLRNADTYTLYVMKEGRKTSVRVPRRIYTKLPVGSCIQIDYVSYASTLIFDDFNIAPVQITRLPSAACAKQP